MAKRRLMQEQQPGVKQNEDYAPFSTTNQVADKTQDRQHFYKFFLDNAQRAINMMIIKHKETSKKDRSSSTVAPSKQFGSSSVTLNGSASAVGAYNMPRTSKGMTNEERLQRPLFERNMKTQISGSGTAHPPRALSNYGGRIQVNLPADEINAIDDGASLEPSMALKGSPQPANNQPDRQFSGKPLMAPKRRTLTGKQPREANSTVVSSGFLKRGVSGNSVLTNVLKNREYSSIGGRI